MNLLMQAPKLETKAAKPGHKGAGEKEKLPEAKRSEIANEVLADPIAEKLRQQRLKLCYTSHMTFFGRLAVGIKI